MNKRKPQKPTSFTKSVTALFATHALNYDADANVINSPQLSQLYLCVQDFIMSRGCQDGWFFDEFGTTKSTSQIFADYMPEIFQLIMESQISQVMLAGGRCVDGRGSTILPAFVVENWDRHNHLLQSPSTQQLVVWWAVDLVALKIFAAFEQEDDSSLARLLKYMNQADAQYDEELHEETGVWRHEIDNGKEWVAVEGLPYLD